MLYGHHHNHYVTRHFASEVLMLSFFEGLSYARALSLCSFRIPEFWLVKYSNSPSFGAGFVVRSVSWLLQLPSYIHTVPTYLLDCC